MESIVAKCGLDCAKCNALIATEKDDDQLRMKTAQEWSALFGANIDYKTINCKGCQQDEVLIGHCAVCKIRTCANEKGFTTCAVCPDFGCNLVQEIWKHDPIAKERLEKIRGT